MKRFLSLCLILSALVFVFGCGGSKKDNVYDYPDEDSADTDTADDPAVEDADDIPDTTTDEDADTASEKDDADTDTSDTGITDNDNDTDTDPTEPTPDEDTDTPEIPEITENHNISGLLQAGSNVSGIEAALYECGKTEKTAHGNTDSNGKYSFNADISAEKTYCVKAGDFASCFKGMSDHVANISEITNAVLLADPTCADLRKSETKVRKYAKLGTGKWLGELDYSKLSGISEGLKLLSAYLNTTDSKTLSEKIAADVNKTDGYEFQKFFNGFKISADKKEVLINVTNPDSNEVTLNVEGDSSVVAEGFKITWTVMNNTAEAAMHKFKSVEPGEYLVRARLGGDPIMEDEGGDPIMGGNGDDGGDPIMITEDSATILFLLEKATDVIDVRDMSKDIVHYIDNGIYAVIPKNTTIKRGNSPVNYLTYRLAKSNGTSQVSKITFEPAGTTFTGDSLYFVYELGTVFGGDPIMLSARRNNADGTSDVLQSSGGDPIMMEDGGDPIMFTAGGDPIMHVLRSSGGDPIMAGDPIMYSAGGDPIMISSGENPAGAAAGGDPIMIPVNSETSRIAAGDPIMMGTSSSVMIAKTGHFSEFLINSNSLPVPVEAIVSRWCDGSFYRGYSPVEFIKKGVTDNKPESTLLPYLTCERFGELGSDLYELMNKPVGFQRNLNLFENIFYVSAFYNRMKARRESGEVAAVTNGIELRSAIAALYTSTTSYNRSATLADMFDSSMIPLAYRGIEIEDYSAEAKGAITGSTESGSKFAAGKNDMMIFANYVTTSAKGPDFSGVSSPMTADKLICAWFNPEIPAQNCSKVYTLNDAGHVSADGTEVSLEEADAIFAHFFMPFNSRISDEEKFSLFRTFFLTLKYAGTVFEGGTALEALNAKLLKAAYLVFDGIDGNVNAVSIEDTFDASAHTVQVLKENVMETKPYITKVSALTDKISLNVAAAGADVEKVLVRIEGYEFDKITDNTRTYYKPKEELREKSIILTPGTLGSGLKPLKELLGTNDVDSLGNITGKVTVVATSKISGKTYTTQKTYEFLSNDESEGVSSKPVPANLQVMLKDSEGHAIPQEANPGIILNPGNRTLYPDSTGLINITELAPASYTIDAFADGYYTKNVGVNVTAGATFGVEIKLDTVTTSSADADLELSVNIATAKHPAKVYVQIYDENMELVANESTRFDNGTNAYEPINIGINSGRYTLLAVGEEMYNYLESITIYEGNNTKEITVVAKNACGNGIVDSAEDCEPSVSGNLTCSDIYPAAPNPGNQVVCNPATCVYDKSECGITLAVCGDGIIDPGEGCDGGAKECSEIMGFEGSKGSAPCASNCSDWITAGNCSKVAADCGTKPANTQWNDGTGKFEQVYNGSQWLPAEKDAVYGVGREECIFSCTKGYKWYNGACIDDPLSLGNICTGETSCFDNAAETTECPVYGSTLFGQDAQYAEASYCTQHSFSTTGNGSQQIVLDGFTHYEWHKVASNSAMTWDAAEEYCRTSNYGGKQLYWRLPSPAELLTIVDSDTTSPALSDIFTVYGYSFWAGEDEKTAGNAWMLGENGGLESVEKSALNHVICVHVNDYDPLQDRFTTDTETVKDAESGLMWQRYYTSAKTWAEALSYCENSSAGEKYDWRLPNRNELASLVDYTKSDGTMSDFPGIAAKEFWTSTSSTGEPAKAWTVDFESGTIAAGSKDDTKYLICVRNDGECLGTDCVNPCSFDPCRNTVNSTGVCKPSEGSDSYSCLCYSGFEWDASLSKCVLTTARYQACDLNLLPANAVWNTAQGISQYHDGHGNWYPTTVPEYNEIPTNKECHFKCNTNFVYERDTNQCVGATRLASCSGYLPANAEWLNPNGQIVQQWQWNETASEWQWLPETTSTHGTVFSPTECRHNCKEHYSWKSAQCTPDTQTVNCDDLPANAVWIAGSTVEQTWNGYNWAPGTTPNYFNNYYDDGDYTSGYTSAACLFRCDNDHFRHNGECVTPCEDDPCGGFANAKSGTCNAVAWDDYVCGCNEGYYWWGRETGCINRKPAFGNICTGQRTCYNKDGYKITCPKEGMNFFGQDANYAAKGTCTHQSFSIDASIENQEIVVDNNLGLEWLYRIPETKYLWEDALNYCDDLNYGNKTDWRLPTRYELWTILDLAYMNMKGVNINYFPDIYNLKNERLWTSEEYDEDKAFIVNMWDGYFFDYSKDSEYSDYNIICVRGNELQKGSFTDNGDETVTDSTTGLVWQKSYVNKTWENALSYCEGLELAGHTDWRLPNKNELESLINHDKRYPASDFPAMPSSGAFWSSTSYQGGSDAYYLEFGTGIPGDTEKNVKAGVRCVRAGLCGAGYFWNGTECATPCSAGICNGVANSTEKCIAESLTIHSCECDEGYFWNGNECVTPCSATPCGSDPNSNGVCTASGITDYSCGCKENYFWNGNECVNPCDSSSCASEPNSNGNCIPESAMQYKCECNEGFYWWDGIGCTGRKQLTIGNICTRTEMCFNDAAIISCPSENNDFYGQPTQYAALGKCTPQDFSIDSSVPDEETVIDNNTGLEWQRKISSDTQVEETEADAYCEDLVYGGHDDWRLPEPNELLSIVNYNETAVNTVYFPDLKNNPNIKLLTSKYYAEPEKDERWRLYDNYQMGFPSQMGVSETMYNRVLCVRGNKMKGAKLSVSERNGNQIVTDSTTGLIWQKTYGTAVIWQDALYYCENLTYAGYSDWRLPNNNEFASLADYDRYQPASAFPDMEMETTFWSADTIIANDPQYTWLFMTANGGLALFYKDYRNIYGESYDLPVMCVRSE
ncbi:DUF1566 domain-containing protein [bacterium]|nr:DUF1566 domain-containing protein [bacterium]